MTLKIKINYLDCLAKFPAHCEVASVVRNRAVSSHDTIFMQFLVIRTYFILNVEQRICAYNYQMQKQISKKVKQHLVTFRSKSFSDLRKNHYIHMEKQLSCCNFSETYGRIYCIGKIIPLQSCKIIDRIYPTARLFYSLLSTNVLHIFAQVLF